MKKLIYRLYENSIIRYLFFGGCTTMVNLVCFYVLRRWNLGLNAANLISIIAAIIFAYVVNSRYVFQNKCNTVREHIQSFVKFISVRAVTMVIEIAGVWLLVEQMKMWDMLGKFATQFLVIVLNYVFSKLIVFK